MSLPNLHAQHVCYYVQQFTQSTELLHAFSSVNIAAHVAVLGNLAQPSCSSYRSSHDVVLVYMCDLAFAVCNYCSSKRPIW